MGKKDQSTEEKTNQRVQTVLQLVKKQSPLTPKQEKFCSNGCVERFLRAKGDNVKKAAKHLRACLAWRESIGTENLIADEFSTEIAEGVAYTAGHDEESRPVMVLRMKQDYQKFHSQKIFTRLLVFTLEVAISTMPKNIEQFILLFDASFFRSAAAFMNLLLAALKIVGEYYPGRLYKAFVIDPPSLFSYLWKGVRPFLELSTATMVVSSLNYEESLEFNDFTAYPRASSLRFDPPSIKSTAKIGSCSSSRFSFTVSHHYDSLKPWYLTLTSDTSSSKVGPTASPFPLGPALISPLNARSLSFASPASVTSRGNISMRKSLFPSTPLPQRSKAFEPVKVALPRTPRPSFLQSPAMFFRREVHVSGKAERSRESFLPFLKFYRRPYDEMIYRSMMRPPLGGLISIVKRRHMSVSQRF
ncbi:SEC14 cytosolic factor-like [Hibiscus syriacus]|uniref:SEC14 cytosolic factor-like n=1 Tax=Hibiscus syriacus TaxID=106335 RepID=UPI001921BA8D|nr:SEC14 cytosolic factor-like [Hibiscus syriacus]